MHAFATSVTQLIASVPSTSTTGILSASTSSPSQLPPPSKQPLCRWDGINARRKYTKLGERMSTPLDCGMLACRLAPEAGYGRLSAPILKAFRRKRLTILQC
ncbi:hypothetical protein ACEPAI_2409 [Sanghuangporus weigelae]